MLGEGVVAGFLSEPAFKPGEPSRVAGRGEVDVIGVVVASSEQSVGARVGDERFPERIANVVNFAPEVRVGDRLVEQPPKGIAFTWRPAFVQRGNVLTEEAADSLDKIHDYAIEIEEKNFVAHSLAPVANSFAINVRQAAWPRWSSVRSPAR